MELIHVHESNLPWQWKNVLHNPLPFLPHKDNIGKIMLGPQSENLEQLEGST
jgi:hypothetical protein